MLTDGFSGAQIASLCNESAMIAARNLADEILNEHFDKAFDRVKWGVKKQQPLGEREKKIAAYHDAGHAIVGWFVPEIKPITKVDKCLHKLLYVHTNKHTLQRIKKFQVSILPNAKGQFVCSMDDAIQYQTLTKAQLMNILAMFMAGMAAEEVVFGSYSAAGGKDIENATKVVTNMV